MVKKLLPRMAMFGTGAQTEVPSDDFGNKASVLARMSSLSIPVPPGFSLGVSICEDYYGSGERLPGDIDDTLKRGVAYLERATGLTFGSDRKPLLVSVRSGAPVSMPGIMDTVLNVGLNRDTLRGLIYMTGDPRFAWDTYRRYLESFGTIVLGHEHPDFHGALREVMAKEGVLDEVQLDFYSLEQLSERYERLLQRNGSPQFPDNAYDQLRTAVTAVLRSWNSPRAENYRKMNLVKGVRGTAVTVQAMVYGNLGLHSGAGVAFSRNPWTGERALLVDFKHGAQGEDVVSGSRNAATQREMIGVMPDAYRDLQGVATKLEQYFRDMQDIEFTVQDGRLFILQSRSGKRGPYAALRIAVDMVEEELISDKEGLERLKGLDIASIVVQRIKPGEPPIGAGVSASSGVASGRIALTSERVDDLMKDGPVILVRETASPDDLPGIGASAGMLTATGARTSHAAVVTRQLGKVCIVGCSDLVIDLPHHRCRIGKVLLHEGDVITLDGSTGNVYPGDVPVVQEKPGELIKKVKSWRAR
jgi:pyruvate,orthophosphate dikinase